LDTVSSKAVTMLWLLSTFRRTEQNPLFHKGHLIIQATILPFCDQSTGSNPGWALIYATGSPTRHLTHPTSQSRLTGATLVLLEK